MSSQQIGYVARLVAIRFLLLQKSNLNFLFEYISPTSEDNKTSCVCVLILLQVLEVGAGNSHLSEEMYRDGITNITCTDLSPVAVKRMHTRFQEFPGQCAQ
jgi:2-polyprenyl-3-methyl-5-hydroxy-6-metoxy-1,4-benzoquinol methylase